MDYNLLLYSWVAPLPDACNTHRAILLPHITFNYYSLSFLHLKKMQLNVKMKTDTLPTLV